MEALVWHLSLPVVKGVHLSGFQGQPPVMDVVKLRVNSVSNSALVNIAPSVKVWFTIAPNLNEAVILTPSAVELLKSVEAIDVIAPPIQNIDELT